MLAIAAGFIFDSPALRTTYHAENVTVRQLFRALYAMAGESAPSSEPIGPGIVRFEMTLWDTFSRRMRKLADKGYIIRTAVADVDTPVLSLSREGEAILGARSMASIVEIGTRSTHGSRRNQVRHDMEMFELYLQVRRSPLFGGWQFEPEIRADNNYTAHGFAKDYDAVVTFRANGRCAVLALEYERSPKRTQDYERIAQVLGREQRVNAVLYATPSQQLAEFVRYGFRNTPYKVYVTTARELAADPAKQCFSTRTTPGRCAFLNSWRSPHSGFSL